MQVAGHHHHGVMALKAYLQSDSHPDFASHLLRLHTKHTQAETARKALRPTCSGPLGGLNAKLPPSAASSTSQSCLPIWVLSGGVSFEAPAWTNQCAHPATSAFTSHKCTYKSCPVCVSSHKCTCKSYPGWSLVKEGRALVRQGHGLGREKNK